MGKLVLYLADGSTLDILLNRERVTIGRRADNDICLPYPAVSAEHASVVTILSDSFLEDLGSTNGTLVNGRPVVKHFLRDRDQIDIGRQKLVFVADDAVQLDSIRVVSQEVAHKATFGERVEHIAPQPAPEARAPAPSIADEQLGASLERDSEAMVEIDRFVSAEVAADARSVPRDSSPARRPRRHRRRVCRGRRAGPDAVGARDDRRQYGPHDCADQGRDLAWPGRRAGGDGAPHRAHGEAGAGRGRPRADGQRRRRAGGRAPSSATATSSKWPACKLEFTAARTRS